MNGSGFRAGDRVRRARGPARGAVGALLACGLLAGACAAPDGDGATAGSGIVSDAAHWSGVAGEPRATASSAFWSRWGDGRAELSSYRLVTGRYGEARDGELVLIYVTEPHDRRRWIKDDDAGEPHRVEVLKLNVSRKFLTGIYPYSAMTSVFSPVDDWGGERFRPVKISASVQEWCGNHHHQVWPGMRGLRSLRLSYFASEGERMAERDVPEGTLYEDALPIQLRELDGSFAGGGDWSGWIVPSLWNVRRGHGEAEPVRGRIQRKTARLEDGTPVTRFTLSYDGYERTFDVESAAPRRILGWRTSVGDTARLVETRRLAYWRLNDLEGVRYREELGLDSAGGVRWIDPPDRR